MRNCDVVAVVVPIEMPSAVEPQDEYRRGSGNLADFDALQIPVCDGAREVHRSSQPSDCLIFRGVQSVAERAQLTTHIMQ